MKTRTLIIMAAALLCLGACASTNRTAMKNSGETLCGGYTAQREISAEELEMFKKATTEMEEELTPLSVATQVVAGINYRFVCTDCTITIFKPLKGEPVVSGIDRKKAVKASKNAILREY